MDRRKFKQTPTTLVKDPRTGEVKRIINSSDTEIGTSALPADLTVHGTISGSIHHTAEGRSYLIAGANVTITSASNGQVTVAAGGSAGAPSTLSYVTLASEAALSAERVLTVGPGLRRTDGGPGTTVTLDVKDNVYASLTGSNTFSAPMTFSSGLSGSMQQTAAGLSYIVAGAGITVTSASNGQVTVASTVSGSSGGGGDPGAQYLVLALTSSLTSERVFSASTGLKAVDGGIGGAYTLRVDDGVFAGLSGSTFSGPIVASAAGGITGSITRTTAGTPFITAPSGNVVTVTTGSNGQIILSGSGGSSGGSGVSALDSLVYAGLFGHRLSLVLSNSVVTSSVTSGSTLYLNRHTSDLMGLHNGSLWLPVTASVVSMSLSALTNNTNYDVFVRRDPSTFVVSMDMAAWTGNARPALGSQDGVYIKSGDSTRRYVGTIRTQATNSTADSVKKRFVWNFYNTVPRHLEVADPTDSWVYDTLAFRVANGRTSNSYELVCGMPTLVRSRVSTIVFSANLGLICSVGIGVDSTSVNSARYFGALTNANVLTPCSADYFDYVSQGYHQIYWLECSGGGDVTFYGDVAFPDFFRYGMFGEFDA